MEIDKTAYVAMILLLVFFLGILYLKKNLIHNESFAMIGSPKVVDRDLLLISNYQNLQDSELGKELQLIDYESVNLEEAVRTARETAPPTPTHPAVQRDYYQTRLHRVSEGESLWSIARNYDVSIGAIVSVNNLTGTRGSLNVGQTLKIPNLDGVMVTVKRGETLSAYANRYGVPVSRMVLVNRLGNAANLRVGLRLFIPGENLSVSQPAASTPTRRRPGFIWPVPESRRMGSGFGWRIHPIRRVRSFHHGIDIPAPQGTRVVASKEGRVQYAGWIRGYGRTVKLEHANNMVTYYAHMSYLAVQTGRYVEQGQTIGRVGATGLATGPHLHFEIRVNGQAVNPNQYLDLPGQRARTSAPARAPTRTATPPPARPAAPATPSTSSTPTEETPTPTTSENQEPAATVPDRAEAEGLVTAE